MSAVTDTISCWVKNKGEITWEQGFREFAVGFISGVSGEFMGDAIEKYGAPAIQKGLKKLGLSDAKIKKCREKMLLM